MSDFDIFMAAREAAATAYVKGQPGPVDDLTAKAQTVTFFGPDGKVISGADAVISAFDQGAKAFGPNGDSRLEIMQSAGSNDVGYWCGLQHAHVETDGKLVPMTLRITELFHRQAGEWKMVHRHADIMKA